MKHHMKSHDGGSHHENFGQSMREESSHRMYRNEVEMPEIAAQAHPGEGQGALPDMGCADFKGEADPIAFGQASYEGMMRDEKKVHAQFRDYNWS